MSGAGGRILQRVLAGLCRRADRPGARPFRRLVNQAPVRRAAPSRVLRPYDLLANGLSILLRVSAVPPDQMLRLVFDRPRDYGEARPCWNERRWRGR